MITAVLTMVFLLAHRTVPRDASTTHTTRIHGSEVKVGDAPEVLISYCNYDSQAFILVLKVLCYLYGFNITGDVINRAHAGRSL